MIKMDMEVVSKESALRLGMLILLKLTEWNEEHIKSVRDSRRKG